MKKIIISDKLFEELRYYNSGHKQDVYEVDGENYVVKKPQRSATFDSDDLQRYHMMAKFPTIFAKVLKITPQEVWQEKLDDKKFLSDLNELLKITKEHGYNSIDEDKEIELDNFLMSIEYQDDDLKDIVVTLDSHSFGLYNKIYKVYEKLKPITIHTNLDIHHKQFGYDESENVKIFDV